MSSKMRKRSASIFVKPTKLVNSWNKFHFLNLSEINFQLRHPKISICISLQKYVFRRTENDLRKTGDNILSTFLKCSRCVSPTGIKHEPQIIRLVLLEISSTLSKAVRLNGFNICFNMRPTQLLNQMSVRLNRSFNIC